MSNNNIPFISTGYEISTWNMHQVYRENVPVVHGVSNFVVPAVSDFIIEKDGNTIRKYQVTHKIGMIAYWEPVYDETVSDGLEDLTLHDLQSVADVFVRTSITPVLAAVHIGLPVTTDTPVGYAKLFSGKTISDPESIISRTLDNDGKVVNDRIPMMADPINLNNYYFKQFNLDRIVEDNSIGTLVIFGIDDLPIGKYTMRMRTTDAIVNYSDTELFITAIELDSALINPANKKEILVEKGYLNASFNPRVFKVYNTGQREEVSLTSRSLKLEGWGKYSMGEENYTYPLSVQYTLAPNEKSDLVSSENGEVITEKYTIRVVDNANSINYKLYPCVEWSESELAYRLTLVVYDSNYKTNTVVTDSISLSRLFNGNDFSVKQTFNYSVNLQTAGITVEEEYLSGTFAIRLLAAPMDEITPYNIYMVPSDTERYYGDKLRTRITLDMGVRTLSIDSDYTQYHEWLDNVYHKLLPPYDSNVIDKAPEPTHVDVTIGDNTVTLDVINQWNVGGKWTYPEVTGTNTATLVWYSYDGDSNRNYLARSTMQVELV